MVLELKDISKRFDDVVALQDVNLDIEEGEFITLLGPSGCGKTTLLRIVAGFLRPDTGDILIDGRRVNDLSPDQRPTGMVFQSYALFPHMTVRDNISFGLRMHGDSQSKIDQKVSEVLSLVGIEGMEDRYPKQLSGGQQQRVALARTLAIEPYVLLLDEPLGALDRKLRVEMRTEVRKLIKEIGITTIFVTHDQEEALTMSDRIAVMERGQIIQVGTPMQIYDYPKALFVATFIGSSNLFRGSIVRGEDGRPLFEAEGLRLPLPPEKFSDRMGDDINLLLRSEHLRLGPLENKQSKDDFTVAGMVSFATHLGRTIEYEVELDTGATLELEVNRSRGETPVDPGTRVWVKPEDPSSYLIVAERRR